MIKTLIRTAARDDDMPPVPAFHLRPDSVGAIVEHTAGRALDLLGIDVPDLPRWGE
ncbi:hypothetical protein KGQ20_37175 [Catenulispora sp. NF23]|uniref:Uncharacterized protein n=1 Tax=Catenulispora pinistramenti TaxID=2705254 RepID=A0ABS5KVD4_9ACTN|nr:hypothetical protein [Catenulispora pinistramenti]MBS2538397.1 hypothetical protein [Catenulispora pinistramenti]MBS2549984.1 hypothetical protein [Catenulispora pinistramenti]